MLFLPSEVVCVKVILRVSFWCTGRHRNRHRRRCLVQHVGMCTEAELQND